MRTLNPDSWRTGKQQRSSAARGYGYRWQKRWEHHLRGEPLCRMCAAQGLVTAATVADHITPHRGDPELFDGPLQSLCDPCHSSAKQREEAKHGGRGSKSFRTAEG